MHPYYQQNEEKLKRQMNAYLILVRLEIEQIFGKAYDEAFEEIWGYYRAQMLERCPYIGGDRSSGTKNLTGCLFFIAVGVCGKNHGLSTMNGAGWRLRSTSAGLQGCRDRCAELHVFSSGRRRGW